MKTHKVIFVDNAKEELKILNKKVGDEKAKGTTKSDHQTLLRAIKQKATLIKENPDFGVHIAKNKIPHEYKREYEANNLWKVNLSKGWRMIYTIKGNEIEILSIVLDIIDHKTYDKKFGYKKR